MSAPSHAAPIGLAVRAVTLDAARALGASLYYPHRLTPLGPLRDFTFTAIAARLGTVTAGILRYSSGIRIDTDAYETSLQVNIPLIGALRTSIGDAHVRATLGRAALYPHDVPTVISGWDEPCAMLAVKLDRAQVEQRLLSHGHAVDLHLTPTLDVSDGTAAAWIRAVRDTIATTQRVPGLDRGLAAYLADRCIDGFVASVLGPGSPEPPSTVASDRIVVERAMDAITYTAGPPLSLGALSAYVGASPRVLQLAFRRLRGQTPMQVQRAERMRRVHADLLRAAAGSEQVSAVALRHGFTHLGRFSAEYRRAYGELPSRTLER